MLDEFKPDICLVQEALTASEAMSGGATVLE
jgi:hypothetical protein